MAQTLTDSLRPRLPERRSAFLEQFDRVTRTGFVTQANRHALAVRGTHVRDPAWLPVLLSEHVADDRNLLDHRFLHAIRREFVAVAARAKQRLREKAGAALGAAPNGDARRHSARSSTA